MSNHVNEINEIGYNIVNNLLEFKGFFMLDTFFTVILF